MATQRLQPADVLAPVRRILTAIDCVGAGAMPAQRPSGFSFQGDLIRLSSAVYFPEQDATRLGRVRVAISKAITISARHALACRSRQ